MPTIDRFREEHGMTQKAFATHLGIDPAQMNRLLAEPQNWTLETVAKLLIGTATDPREILARLDAQPAQAEAVHGDATSQPVAAESAIMPESLHAGLRHAIEAQKRLAESIAQAANKSDWQRFTETLVVADTQCDLASSRLSALAGTLKEALTVPSLAEAIERSSIISLSDAKETAQSRSDLRRYHPQAVKQSTRRYLALEDAA
jgi:plasmid maintenance system antidote protein VapI